MRPSRRGRLLQRRDAPAWKPERTADPVVRDTLLVRALPTKSVSSVEMRRITLLPIVAVRAGLAARRRWLGTVLGVLATEATAVGFNGTWAIRFGHEGSPSAVLLRGGAGVVTGALSGLAGRAARARPGLRHVLPALSLLEPVMRRIGFLITAPLLHVGYAGQIDAREWFAYGVDRT